MQSRKQESRVQKPLNCHLRDYKRAWPQSYTENKNIKLQKKKGGKNYSDRNKILAFNTFLKYQD